MMTRFRLMLRRRWLLVTVLAGTVLLSVVALAYGLAPSIPADASAPANHIGTNCVSCHVVEPSANRSATPSVTGKPAVAPAATTSAPAKSHAAPVAPVSAPAKAPAVPHATTGIDDDGDGDFDDCGDPAGADDDANEVDDDADEADDADDDANEVDDDANEVDDD